ncbi:hypothetical protein JCM10212_000332 [Sporobolomyces blumeae]
MSLIESAKDVFYALTGSCCKTDATLKLNGRSFKILKLLGEGGFSYVYLAQDQESKRLFALKKIRCPLGSDSVKAALKEVEAYKRFRHPNIIRCLDSCVVQDREADGKVIYLFLPYYKNGTVQHIISANVVNRSHYPESSMLEIFRGACLAVRAMHQYRSLGPSVAASGSQPTMRPSRSTASIGTKAKKGGKGASSYPPLGPSTEEEDDDEEDEEEASGGLRSGGEGEALIGGLDATQARLQESTGSAMASRIDGFGDVPGRGDEDAIELLGRVGDADATGGLDQSEGGGLQPWAHRDIKPANIMLSDDGVPILMDFGSALPARIEIPDRRTALLQQDIAAEHCSMPFRAPELFDVKTGVPLTESVDIWSLGCTLYCMAYGTSPFETAQQSEHGGSIAMAVLGGQYRIPDDGRGGGGGAYSEGTKEIIRRCLKVKPDERPDIDEVISLTEQALARLQ